MPTIPTSSLLNLAVSRGDQIEDTTGGTVTTTETVIGTVAPFFGNTSDRVRLIASVIGRIQITATTKGSQGGVTIEFRLRKDTSTGTVVDTKSVAISYSAVSPLITVPATLIAVDIPALLASSKNYVLTAKKLLGTNITATAEWDEMKLQAIVFSA